MDRITTTTAILLASLTAITPAQAEDDESCSLKMITEFDLAMNGAGIITIPVVIDEQPEKLILDTGAFWSVLGANVVKDLANQRSRWVSEIGADGGESKNYVKVPSFQIGPLKLKDADFFVTPNFSDGSIAGNLGANLLQASDLEIDPGKKKIRLFSQDHCKGQVVYWKYSEVARFPFHRDDGKIVISILLDGKPIKAQIDTGASDSFLSTRAAAKLFNLTPDSPDMQQGQSAIAIDGGAVQTYKHQFQTLDLDGIIFQHPWILIADDKISRKRGDQADDKPPDMILGMHQLRLLHLYVAYKEGMLYASTVQGDALALGNDAGTPPTGASGSRADPMDRANAEALDESVRAHFDKKEFAAAITDLNREIAIMPGEAELYYERGAAEVDLRDFATADKDLGRALDLDSTLGKAHAARCFVRANLSRFMDGIADCDAALAAEPGSREVLSLRAALNLNSHQFDAAIRDYSAVLQQTPDDAKALYARGLARQARGDVKGGGVDMAAALRLDSSIAAQFGRMSADHAAQKVKP